MQNFIYGGSRLNNKFGKRIGILFIAVIVLLASACSNGGKSADKSENETGGQSAAASSPASESSNTGTDAKEDPLGKYDTPIELTTAGIAYPNVTYQDGDSIDSNVWTKLYEEKLGIKTKHIWMVPEDQYQAKMTASIASNDIPDLMLVDEKFFKLYLDSGIAEDLTDVFEKYASDDLKELVYGGDAGQAHLDYAKVNGRLMGLPAPYSHPAESGDVLYVRKDWLDKLKLPEPETMDDVLKISEAFTNQDPDGNNKKDTFGLAVASDFVASSVAGGIGDLLGFYNGYHLYPGFWQEDASGQLANGIINPELKKPLAQLQEMYKSGQIDKEFGVKDRWKVGDDIAAGKIGMFYGVNWAVYVALIGNHKNDPQAEWVSYPIPSIDSDPAKISGKPYFSGVYVVKKGAKNPEALIKLANLSLETLYGEYAKAHDQEVNDIYSAIKVGDQTYNANSYQVVNFYPGKKNLDSQLAVMDVLENGGDAAKLTSEGKTFYDNLMKWNAGEADDLSWQMHNIYGVNTILAANYLQNDLYVQDKFNTIQTDKMVEKQKSLDDLALTVFTKIILGEPVDTFDKFIEDWKALGGQEITNEVNEWYSTVKK